MKTSKIQHPVIVIYFIVLALLFLSLLVLYFFSLAFYFAAPPSAVISKDYTLAETAFSQNTNAEYHIATMFMEDGSTWFATIDGTNTKLLHVDKNGNLIQERSLGLDLYRAVQLEATILADGRMAVYYLQDGLWRALVNLDNGSYSLEKITEDCAKISLSRHILVCQTSTGLYASSHENPGQKQFLKSQYIESWVQASYGDKDIIFVTSQQNKIYDVDLIKISHLDKSLEILQIYKNTNISYVKLVEDIFMQDSVITILYLWTDNVHKLNYFTIQHLDLDDGTILQEYQNHHAIHFSRFRIAAVRQDGSVDIILPAKTLSGENLVLVTLTGQYQKSWKAITKTRYFSRILAWRPLADHTLLFFSDFMMTKRLIKVASSDPAFSSKASDLGLVNFWYVGFISLLMLMLALFMGSIGHLLPSVLPAFIFVMLLDQKLKPAPRKALLQFSLGILFQTVLKLGLTWLMVNRTAFSEFHPLFIGKAPYIYIAVLLISLISWLLSVGVISPKRHCTNTTIDGFKMYIFSDFSLYTTLVFMYAATNMIIGKL
ncbi:MAG: hypothetical protein KKI09_01990 [Spirochaetes bacterium]|nr:hypothetical protein [Spirochaetota bacterium]